MRGSRVPSNCPIALRPGHNTPACGRLVAAYSERTHIWKGTEGGRKGEGDGERERGRVRACALQRTGAWTFSLDWQGSVILACMQ